MPARGVTILALLGIVLAGSTPHATGASPPAPLPGFAEAARIPVIASFYPLFEFAGRIGGGGAVVRNLVPAGASAHDYEPTAREVAALRGARLVIYNGAGFEPWIKKILPTLPASVVRVNATSGLPLMRGRDAHGHAESGLDPHVWLDPVLARQQAGLILAGFVRADPGRRAAYETNAAALRADFDALHRRYADTLKTCRKQVIVTAHAAFGYLAARYGLTMVPIFGLSPEVEPSPARLRAVLREVRKHGVRVIYYETLTSPRVAQAIAREVGAKTLVLNPVEGLTPAQRAGGATYFTVMDDNLRNLVEGLDCR